MKQRFLSSVAVLGKNMEQIPTPPGSCPETQRTRCLGIASGFGKNYMFRLKKRRLKGHLMAVYSELMRSYRGAEARLCSEEGVKTWTKIAQGGF